MVPGHDTGRVALCSLCTQRFLLVMQVSDVGVNGPQARVARYQLEQATLTEVIANKIIREVIPMRILHSSGVLWPCEDRCGCARIGMSIDL